MQAQVVTTRFKWLRGVAKGQFTGLHSDKVFLGQGSSRLLTAWLPITQVAHACAGSHNDKAVQSLLTPSCPCTDEFGGRLAACVQRLSQNAKLC